jgi:hypothetical protein
MSSSRPYEAFPVNVRVKISALWTSMLFVFAYVDLFGFFRADFRAEVAGGTVSGVSVGEPFLLGITGYVVVPALMVFLTLVLPARLDRIVNVALAGLYALTCAGSAVGEWWYYLLGTGVELVLLAAVAYYAWTWGAPTAPSGPDDAVRTPRSSSV